MRIIPLTSALVLGLSAGTLGGCALPKAVQRVGVEYNGAVAGMSNELALLNIVRAKEGMPLHYTSVGRLSGSVVVKGTTTFGQFKDKGRTFTGKHTETITSAPLTTVSDELTQQATKGGNGVTPSVSGEVTTGPSFDITILDGQKFYQGVLAAIPFPTIENYLNQGMDNRLVLRLLVERIEFRARTDALGYKKGQLVKELVNKASGDEAKTFASEIDCYVLSGTDSEKKAKALAPLSRVNRDATGAVVPLTLEDLSRFDGEKFELARLKPAPAPIAPASPGHIQPDLNLKGYVTPNAADDGDVMIVRPASTKRMAELTLVTELLTPRTCHDAVPTTDRGPKGAQRRPEWKPGSPPAEAIYLGDGKLLALNKAYIDARKAAVDARKPPPPVEEEMKELDVDLQITFRSPERLIRFLGEYLQAMEDKDAVYKIDGVPIIELEKGRVDGAVVSTQGLSERWSITKKTNLRQNMRVLAIVEQLINLHKESSERPVTVPVQVVP